MLIQGGEKRGRSVAGAASVALALGVLGACHDDAASSSHGPVAGRADGPGARAAEGGTSAPTASLDPVARVGDDALSMAALEAPLAIPLYELALAGHRLRRERLDAWIQARLEARGRDAAPGPDVWDRLRAPTPPRFDLPPSDARLSGPDDAIVVVTQFVDFASSHSRRLQPVLAHVQALEPDRVRVEDRQLPRPFHRHARDAAEAARCALAQDAYAPFAELLLLEQGALAGPDLARHAARVGLDAEGFARCVEARAGAAAVDRDLALATSIGVDRAATVFVNGRYVAGRPDASTLAAVVAGEIERAGGAPRRATTPSRPPGPTHPMPGDGRTPRVPDALFADPEFVVTLDPASLRDALAAPRALAAPLEPTRAEFGGERLLKLRRVERDGLWDRLGLEAGDVLLAVDGEFVTADRNPFFEALAAGGTVRVIVMRRGRPRRFEYRIPAAP